MFTSILLHTNTHFVAICCQPAHRMPVNKLSAILMLGCVGSQKIAQLFRVQSNMWSFWVILLRAPSIRICNCFMGI